uniref:Uncharacterized protein n=1 Tax=candidate division WOR-3 bacterium TaxID=2052148 RepID=A0A7C6AA84_UNCW3
MKCPLCNRRKGIRHCPALNSLICSLCCGTKRRRTIICPDDCVHLIAGREYQVQRINDFEPLEEIRKLSPDFLNNIEQSIILVRDTRFRNLLDREVKEGLENLLKTIETAERKIIYEYRSTNPRIQIVTDSVKQMIEKQQKGEDGLRPVSVEETKACLMAIIVTLRSLVRQNPESTIYLDFIHRYTQGIIRKSINSLNPPKAGKIIY